MQNTRKITIGNESFSRIKNKEAGLCRTLVFKPVEFKIDSPDKNHFNGIRSSIMEMVL